MNSSSYSNPTNWTLSKGSSLTCPREHSSGIAIQVEAHVITGKIGGQDLTWVISLHPELERRRQQGEEHLTGSQNLVRCIPCYSRGVNYKDIAEGYLVRGVQTEKMQPWISKFERIRKLDKWNSMFGENTRQALLEECKSI